MTNNIYSARQMAKKLVMSPNSARSTKKKKIKHTRWKKRSIMLSVAERCQGYGAFIDFQTGKDTHTGCNRHRQARK